MVLFLYLDQCLKACFGVCSSFKSGWVILWWSGICELVGIDSSAAEFTVDAMMLSWKLCVILYVINVLDAIESLTKKCK